MIKEAKIAKSFKFTKMTKKIPFLPALHPLDEGFQKMNSINIGDTYVDGRDRNKLCFPDKSVMKCDEAMSGWKI